MFQVFTIWNLIDPVKDRSLRTQVKNIKLRGYQAFTSLTGQFANAIHDGQINALSVSDIADIRCSTRRNIYFRKGKNKNFRQKQKKYWGGTAGKIVERYISSFFNAYMNRKNLKKYVNIAKSTNRYQKRFEIKHNRKINSLKTLAAKEYEDSSRLLKLLTINGRAELGMKLIHSLLFENKSMDYKDIILEDSASSINMQPNPIQIGINKPSTPDFLIKNYDIVGDIKSGVKFEEPYVLTCAGYALAYENWQKKNKENIDWGVIYFLPTRVPTDFAKPLSFAQIYIFPIDDILRKWFLDVRDFAYDTIVNDNLPKLPKDKEHCRYCNYKEICQKIDLEI